MMPEILRLNRIGIAPQADSRLSRRVLRLRVQLAVGWALLCFVLLVVPCEPCPHLFKVRILAVRKHHLAYPALVAPLVQAIEDDSLSGDHLRQILSRCFAEGLAALWSVDARHPYRKLPAIGRGHGDRIAVHYLGDLRGLRRCETEQNKGGRKKESRRMPPKPSDSNHGSPS